MNTCAFLAKVARFRGSVPAIRYGEDVLSYEAFYHRVLALGGNLLARGLETGDRVAFVMANSPSILEVIYGCFAAGLVVVPINARLHPREIAYIVQNSGAKALIHGPEYQDGILQLCDAFTGLSLRVCTEPAAGAVDYAALFTEHSALKEPLTLAPETTAWLFYTSGTTGRPKGAIWTHRTIRTVIMNYLADVHNIQPDDAVLHAAPLSHGSGIVALPAIARGATNIILDTKSFEPKVVFKLIQQFGISHIAFLAPTQIIRMLEEYRPGEFDLSALRAICYGGAPIYVEHLRQAMEAFGPVFTQIYGQGEAPITITGLSAVAHAALLAAGDARIGSAGTIRTDVEVRIVDADDREVPVGQTGEVVVRGDVVMPGYWNNPEATAETLRNGWLHTGDIGLFDDQGYLYLLDRAKDVIISGGNNIYPREVEEIIVNHPAVATAVVLGIPHEYWGEAVHAVVVREPGASVSEAEIIDFCGKSLAGYKKPKSVEFVEELPVSGYGKVLRRELRDRYWAGHDRKLVGGAGLSAGRVPASR
jgi:acyl-CoA synthetase (AMP-forming)/AMP-acid ligase II